jgi:hypothetical protein
VAIADHSLQLARQLLEQAGGLFEAARQPLDAARCNHALADLRLATDGAAPQLVPDARRAKQAQRS